MLVISKRQSSSRTTMSFKSVLIFIACWWAIEAAVVKGKVDSTIVFDDSLGYGRTFDGIGGLSGGGATSKLLVNYPTEQRDQILDYMFKPNFGASLQILKVEIGGDMQSTDGTEASHMHNSWDENYYRGYEWWLMVEAKKRNPDIKLYGLPWGFPGWIGQGTRSPYANPEVTADYVVRWINGAKTYYNLTIDYIGIWNERPYNINYIKILRNLLDQRGFENVLIIASDDTWKIADEIEKDADLAKDIFGIGCHYPGTYASNAALKTGKQLWSSEDYSTFNDEVGAGCWARILNQNYVNGHMTATISWNLIASYYEGLPYFRDGLMTAIEPWSGHYVVQSPIWVSAHTTQFTSIGWKYLDHGSGVGKLAGGGSYVGLVSPDGEQFTIVLETMTHDHSKCIRPDLPAYNVTAQDVIITLKGRFAQISKLNVWYSKLVFNGQQSNMFHRKDAITFVNGQAKLSLGQDEIYTLTTVNGGQRGYYPNPPASKPFPRPYKDDFEGYALHEEPYNLAQQTGSFEVLMARKNQFIRQMVLETPISWCEAEIINKAVNILGDISWNNTFVEIDFEFPSVNATDGVFVAARVDVGGCNAFKAMGIYFFVFQDKYILANDLARTKVVGQGSIPSGAGWHKLSLLVQDQIALGAYDMQGIFNVTIPSTPRSGFAAIGTDSFGLADFDNLYLASEQEGQIIMEEYFQKTKAAQRGWKSEEFHKAEAQPMYFVKEHH